MRNGPNTVVIQIIGSLAAFLPVNKNEQNIELNFRLNPAAKDLIESLGIPHVEIFGLEVNGCFTSLDYNVRDGDQLVVYPRGKAQNIDRDDLIKHPDRLPYKFITDVHLGKLTRTLRLLGINTASDKHWDDVDIIDKAVAEGRAVLTRDLDLLKHGKLEYGYWVRNVEPHKQVEEVCDYFELRDRAAPFTRCMVCNGKLVPVELENVAGQVPENVRQWCSEFWQCKKCGKAYWKGSHYEKLAGKVNHILGQ